jgi:hypothetical protein
MNLHWEVIHLVCLCSPKYFRFVSCVLTSLHIFAFSLFLSRCKIGPSPFFKLYTCTRPWRPIGLWDVEAPTFSRQLARRWRWSCQPYTPWGRPIYPRWFLVLISIRGRVDPRAVMRLKNPMTLSGIEPAILRFAELCPYELHYRAPLIFISVLSHFKFWAT